MGLALSRALKVNTRQSAVYFLETLLARLIIAGYAALGARRITASQMHFLVIC